MENLDFRVFALQAKSKAKKSQRLKGLLKVLTLLQSRPVSLHMVALNADFVRQDS
tara:strand:- start:1181 stop:1345 length:165 start_codon:yes stop_codon:yes gene_type:complete